MTQDKTTLPSLFCEVCLLFSPRKSLSSPLYTSTRDRLPEITGNPLPFPLLLLGIIPATFLQKHPAGEGEKEMTPGMVLILSNPNLM